MYTEPVVCPFCDIAFADISTHLCYQHDMPISDILNLLWERVVRLEKAQWTAEEIEKCTSGARDDADGHT